jgi:hypothetical protein
VVSKEGKLPYLKNFFVIVHMLHQKYLRTFKFSIAWHNITSVSSRIFLSLWLPLPSYYRRHKLLSGQQSANKLGKKSSNATWMHKF